MRSLLVNDLVSENSVFAYVLHYFGISFYEYSDNTLEEACSSKNLNTTKVLESLKAAIESPALKKHELIDYPIELIMEYLKHAHHHFAKYKLPYLNNIIQSFNKVKHAEAENLINDLIEIFPSFNREFVEHIYEEEDELFTYVADLSKFVNEEPISVGKILKSISMHSLQTHAMEHGSHESGMEGIRKLTHNYSCPKGSPTHLKVIMNSLKDFENDLIEHAKIENEIFFPKALQLESKAKQKLALNSKLN
ncbi:MAG: hemerythrin domain-containing protein [Cytophagales bacterium]